MPDSFWHLCLFNQKNLFMKSNEFLGKVMVKVSFRSAGNAISNKDVAFEVWKNGLSYKAVADLDIDQRRLASIPPEFDFEINDGKIITAKGNKDGNLQVIKDIIEALKDEQRT